MGYVICIGIFLVCLVDYLLWRIWDVCILPNFNREWISIAIIIIFLASGLISIVWSVFGGYKCITKPEYEPKLYANVDILGNDCYVSEKNKHDIARIDEEECKVYLDVKSYNDGKIEVVNSEEPKLEVYREIPKNKFFSVDLFFNRNWSYKVYIPDNYEIIIGFLQP